MRTDKTAFSGRVILDHLAKTAGQALNEYLRTALGRHLVTDNLISNYRESIQTFGGEYSVISGHMTFDGSGLDPRYQHITCLREPVSRAVSWILFVLHNHAPDQLPGLYETVATFVKSDGENLHELRGYFCNPYLEHFSSIDFVGNYSSKISDEILSLKHKIAFEALMQYDVIGIYENFEQYIHETLILFNLPTVRQLPKVNVTQNEKVQFKISEKLLEVLTDANQDDIIFYNKVVATKVQIANL